MLRWPRSNQAYTLYIHNRSTKTFRTIPHHHTQYQSNFIFLSLVPMLVSFHFSVICIAIYYNGGYPPNCHCEHASHCLFHVIWSSNQWRMYLYITWIRTLIEFIYFLYGFVYKFISSLYSFILLISHLYYFIYYTNFLYYMNLFI